MTITTISYQKTFNLGNYSSERIGVEICINEGEDAKFALNEAKNLVEEYHRENLPTPIANEQTIIPVVQAQKPLSKEEALIQDINSCTETKVLESYQLIVRSKPELQIAYDKKMESLLNK